MYETALRTAHKQQEEEEKTNEVARKRSVVSVSLRSAGSTKKAESKPDLLGIATTSTVARMSTQSKKVESKPDVLSIASSSADGKSPLKFGTPPQTARLSTPAMTKPRRSVVVEKLSQYIKSYKNKHHHPVFDLIQNDRTAADGRKLMDLEDKAKRCNDELEKLVAAKARLTRGIAAEEREIKSISDSINLEDRRVHNMLKDFYSERFFANHVAGLPLSTLTEKQLWKLCSAMEVDPVVLPG